MNKELIQYITDARIHGLTEQEIKQNLLDAGWDAANVEDSFAHVKAQEAKTEQLPPKTKPVSLGVKTEAPAALAQSPAGEVHASMASIVGAETSPALAPVAATFGYAETPWYKKPAFYVAPIIILLLAAGGYFAYAKYGSFSNLWNAISGKLGMAGTNTQNKTVPLKSGSVYQNNFKVSYHDPLSYQSNCQPNDYSCSGLDDFFGKLKDFTVSFDGSFYVDSSIADNPQSSSDVKYTFASGNTSFSTGLSYKLIDKTFYVNVGDNPLFSAMVNSFQQQATSSKITWIKLDLNKFQQEISQDSNSDYASIKEFFDPSLRTDLNKLWEDAKLVTVDSTVGKETVNGASTIHYKNTLDKQALKKLLSDNIARLAKSSGDQITDQDQTNINLVIGALVDKLQVKEFETWVGASDYHLYKVHLVTNAPSLVSIIQQLSTADFTMSSNANEAKRLADISQMRSALEIYYNDKGGYPDAKNGKPLDLTPIYIGILPTAPAAGGNCTDYYNNYWYQPTGTASKTAEGKTVYSSYELTFCLGSDTNGYKAGIAKASPTGIQDNIPCPSKDSNCTRANPATDPNQALQKQIQDTVNKIDYSAEFRVDADYHDYDKQQKLDVPTGAYDILNALTDARASARDAKRLADVRQLSSALELYFNDKNQYPDQWKDLTPTYIGIIPTAPTPPDGSCNAQDNTYTYAKTKPDQYTVTFCLGNDVGGYKAGKHVLTSSGIQ